MIFEGDRANRYEIIDGQLFVTRALDWKHQAVCINLIVIDEADKAPVLIEGQRGWSESVRQGI